MAKLSGLAHVGLFITDIERSIAFYRDVLSFELIWNCELDEADGSVTKVGFVRNGGLTIELVQTANPAQRGDGWFDHVAMAVEDIEAVAEELRNKGVVFESEAPVFCDKVFPNGAKWILFRGPDGEHLEINEVM